MLCPQDAIKHMNDGHCISGCEVKSAADFEQTTKRMAGWLITRHEYAKSEVLNEDIPVSDRDNSALICSLVDIFFHSPGTHKIHRQSFE